LELRLQVPAHQQVELLVGAAELEVTLQRDRVVALHQRVQELVHADGRAGLVALVEVIALHHARHRVLGGELDHAARAERVAPLGVAADLRLLRVQDQRGLLEVGLGVGLDLLTGQRRPRGVAAGRIADQRGEVANQEDHLVAQVLELPHLVEHDGVAQVQVGCGRVQAQLDLQWHTFCLRPCKFVHPVTFG
jgi:hypothetical protein